MGTTAAFRCTIRQDAWITHEVIVPKDENVRTQEAAAAAAMDVWNGYRNDLVITETGANGFDEGECSAEDDDVEEIDADELAEYQEQHTADSDAGAFFKEKQEEFRAMPCASTARLYLLAAVNTKNALQIETAAL